MGRFRAKLDKALLMFDRRAGTGLHETLGIGSHVASAVAPDRRAWLRAMAASVLLSQPWWRRPVRIRVRGPSGPRWFTVVDFETIRVLEEIFFHAEYAAPLPSAPRRILDLGSNVGASILFFALRYPGSHITGLEASRALFPLLRTNVGDLPNVTLRHAAVSARAGRLTFYEGASSWSGSTHAGGEAPAEHATEVQAVPLDDLVAEGFDLVKIDIEGGEWDVLPASTRLDEVPVVVGEIHAPPDSEETARLLALFRAYSLCTTPPDPAKGQVATVFTAVRRSGAAVGASAESPSR